MAIVVPFVLTDTDGNPQAGVDLSAAGVVRVSSDGGITWANRAAAAPVSREDGVYTYAPDNTELTGSFVLVKVVKTGYRTVVEREDLGTSVADAVTAINAHTDTATAAVTTAVNAHTDTEATAIETAVNGHTDTATSSLATSAALATAQTAITDIQTDVDELQVTAAGLATSTALAAVANSLSTDTAAIEAAIASIPTNPVLDSDARINHLDADVSSRATDAHVLAIPTNPLLTTDSRLNHLDADVSSRLAPTVAGRTLNVSAGGLADASVVSMVTDAIAAGALSAAAITKILDALDAYVQESGTDFPNAETFGQRQRIMFSILALKAPADLFASPYEFRDGADTMDRAAYTMVDGIRTPTALDGR